MCRHLAWLGAPRTLAQLMLEPPAGLLTQSYAPRRQKRGLMNADGWGVGFFEGAGVAGAGVAGAGVAGAGVGPAGEVRRWRSSRPLWGDASFASVAPALSSGAVLAAVRSATAGMPMDESAAAPFFGDGGPGGRWLLSHNGRVSRDVLPARSDAESVCDSAVLAAHVFAQGVEQIVDTVRAVAVADPDAYLNLLLTDGQSIVGITWGDELSYLAAADGVAVASEPWDDDPGWVDVPDHHLITVDFGGIHVTDLEA